MGRWFMICEKTVFQEFIIRTSDEMEAGITGMKFQIYKKIKQAYLSIMIEF